MWQSLSQEKRGKLWVESEGVYNLLKKKTKNQNVNFSVNIQDTKIKKRERNGGKIYFREYIVVYTYR